MFCNFVEMRSLLEEWARAGENSLLPRRGGSFGQLLRRVRRRDQLGLLDHMQGALARFGSGGQGGGVRTMLVIAATL